MSLDDEMMKEGLREMVLGLQAENTRLKAEVERLKHPEKYLPSDFVQLEDEVTRLETELAEARGLMVVSGTSGEDSLETSRRLREVRGG